MFGAWGLTGVPKQRKTEKAGLSLWRESCLMLGAKGFFWELISEGRCFLENCYADELTCAMRLCIQYMDFLNVEIMFEQNTFLPHEFKLYCKTGWFQQHQRWLKCRLKPSFGRWGIPQRSDGCGKGGWEGGIWLSWKMILTFGVPLFDGENEGNHTFWVIWGTQLLSNCHEWREFFRGGHAPAQTQRAVRSGLGALDFRAWKTQVAQECFHQLC